GGAFIMLPQVYTEDADRPGWRHSNLGMYRAQLSGGEYLRNREVGLHYQIHRGLGLHHAAAIRRGVPFRLHLFVRGPPPTSSAVRRRRTPASAKSSTNSPARSFRRWCRASTPSTQSMPPASTRCCSPSAASATFLTPSGANRRNCSRVPTRFSVRGSCRWPS